MSKKSKKLAAEIEERLVSIGYGFTEMWAGPYIGRIFVYKEDEKVARAIVSIFVKDNTYTITLLKGDGQSVITRFEDNVFKDELRFDNILTKISKMLSGMENAHFYEYRQAC